MLIIFIINICYNISKLCNCTTQICMIIMPIIHIVHQIVTKILLHMQLMGHGGLFMDEYNLINIHMGG
jgi:hypothetical protein